MGIAATFLASARPFVVSAPSILGAKVLLTQVEMRNIERSISRNWPEQNNYLRCRGLDPRALNRAYFPNEDLSIAAARADLRIMIDKLAPLEFDLAEARQHIFNASHDQIPAYFAASLASQQHAVTRVCLTWLDAKAQFRLPCVPAFSRLQERQQTNVVCALGQTMCLPYQPDSHISEPPQSVYDPARFR